MLNKLYHKGVEIKSAFLNGIKVFGEDSIPVEPSEDMGLRKDYSGTGWYKATDTGTVFSKDVPSLETHVFSDSPKTYFSVYTKGDAKTYGERAAVSNITDMSYMFQVDESFNQDISSWDVSNVTSMQSMFQYATLFNQDISSWDVSKVTNMSYTFSQIPAFNQDISSWDVSSVTTMQSMFYVNGAFNQDISSWDVSNVTNMQSMFNSANTFNQDISSWDVSKVTNMSYMFNGSAFNQDLSGWCVTNIVEEPLNFSSLVWTLPKPIWGTCPKPDMGLRADYSGTGWYKATDSGTVFSKGVPALETHVFSDSPKEYVNVNTSQDAILYGERAAVSNLTDMSYMFQGSTTFNQDISSWDVSNVTDMNYMFGDSVFNQDISSWDVSSVTNMANMFQNTKTFNQDISSWDVSSVTNMYSMFYVNGAFNQGISSWNVSNVVSMNYMFADSVFNQDLSGWCVGKITTPPDYFSGNTPMTPEKQPIWGTCPRGENVDL